MSDGCRNGCRSEAVALQGLRPLRCFTVIHLCGVYSTIMKPSGDAVGAPMASTQCQPGERNCPSGDRWLPPLLRLNGGWPGRNKPRINGRGAQASRQQTRERCRVDRRAQRIPSTTAKRPVDRDHLQADRGGQFTSGVFVQTAGPIRRSAFRGRRPTTSASGVPDRCGRITSFGRCGEPVERGMKLVAGGRPRPSEPPLIGQLGPVVGVGDAGAGPVQGLEFPPP